LAVAGGLAVEGFATAGAQGLFGGVQQLEPLLVAGFQRLAGLLNLRGQGVERRLQATAARMGWQVGPGLMAARACGCRQ
jgi:hypothetical protein